MYLISRACELDGMLLEDVAENFPNMVENCKTSFYIYDIKIPCLNRCFQGEFCDIWVTRRRKWAVRKIFRSNL